MIEIHGIRNKDVRRHDLYGPVRKNFLRELIDIVSDQRLASCRDRRLQNVFIVSVRQQSRHIDAWVGGQHTRFRKGLFDGGSLTRGV